MRRLIMLISVGWLPPYLCPSGAFLDSQHERLFQALNEYEGYAKTGAASLPMTRGIVGR